MFLIFNIPGEKINIWNMLRTHSNTPCKVPVSKHSSNLECFCQIELSCAITKLSALGLAFDHQKSEHHILSNSLNIKKWKWRTVINLYPAMNFFPWDLSSSSGKVLICLPCIKVAAWLRVSLQLIVWFNDLIIKKSLRFNVELRQNSSQSTNSVFLRCTIGLGSGLGFHFNLGMQISFTMNQQRR